MQAAAAQQGPVAATEETDVLPAGREPEQSTAQPAEQTSMPGWGRPAQSPDSGQTHSRHRGRMLSASTQQDADQAYNAVQEYLQATVGGANGSISHGTPGHATGSEDHRDAVPEAGPHQGGSQSCRQARRHQQRDARKADKQRAAQGAAAVAGQDSPLGRVILAIQWQLRENRKERRLSLIPHVRCRRI